MGELKTLPAVFAFSILSATVLSSCSGPANTLRGNWQTEVNVANAFNAGLSDNKNLVKRIGVSTFAVDMDLALNKDGTYTFGMDDASYSRTLETAREVLGENLNKYVKSAMEADGLQNIQLSDLNVDLASTVDSFLENVDLRERLNSISSNGNYVVEDGKIYLLPEDETTYTESSPYFTYTLSEGQLTVSGISPDNEILDGLLPMVFTKNK